MQAATRRNLALAALGLLFLFVLWQIPGRGVRGGTATPGVPLSTPRPTATPQGHWRELQRLEGQGNQDFCAADQVITVPGPWRVRANTGAAGRDVRVNVYDQQGSHLYARVWAAGDGHGEPATIPQGNGSFCLQVEAEGDYTLLVEAWEAPR